MKKIKKTKNQGILFWITGLSGSGKSSIGKILFNKIQNKYGPTIILHGDDLRKIFNLKGYSKEERKRIGIMYIKFLKLIINQKINVIMTVVGLQHSIRELNKKLFKNYVEIFIKSDLRKILKFNKKKIYSKYKTNITGLDLKPEFPKKPDLIINNNFTKTIKEISDNLFKKIIQII